MNEITQWQYLVLRLDTMGRYYSRTKNEWFPLNDLGQVGWEIVSTFTNHPSMEVYGVFKRRAL